MDREPTEANQVERQSTDPEAPRQRRAVEASVLCKAGCWIFCMNLTKFTDFSLRTLIYLAVADKAEPVPVGDIAAAYGISQQHLVKVVQVLVRDGYVHTARGRGGGVRLAMRSDEINLGELVRKTEDLSLLECFSPEDDQCVISSSCRLRGVLHVAMRRFLEELDKYTLADVTRRPEALRPLLSLRRRR